MDANAELNAKIAAARRELMALPGVIGVGYGYKEQAGEVTRKLALRVYVREKKPLGKLDPRDVIPKELNGLRTDVVLPPVVRDVQGSCQDFTHHGTMIGGIAVTNLKAYLAGSASNPDADSGTLGCICTLNDVGGRDNVGFLSCHHVIGAAGARVGDTIYQPNFTASPFGRRDYHPVGHLHKVGVSDLHPYAYPGESRENYYIDCAAAKLHTKFSSWCDTNCGVKFDTRIRDLDLDESTAVAGFARVGPADLREDADYVVYKVGAVTGRTVGQALDVAGVPVAAGTEETRPNTFLMRYRGGNCGGGLRTADEGDSGSAVVNEDRRVVGILNATVDVLRANVQVCHIHPILDALDVSIRTTGSGPAASGGGTISETRGFVLPPTPTRERAAALRERVLFSRKGKDLYRLVERHREEVLLLVNRVRPVTVAWHRNRGPDFLFHMAEAARDARHRVPAKLEGTELPGALERVLDALVSHGSPELQHDIDRHRDYLDRLAREVNDIEGLCAELMPERKAKVS